MEVKTALEEAVPVQCGVVLDHFRHRHQPDHQDQQQNRDLAGRLVELGGRRSRTRQRFEGDRKQSSRGIGLHRS